MAPSPQRVVVLELNSPGHVPHSLRYREGHRPLGPRTAHARAVGLELASSAGSEIVLNLPIFVNMLANLVRFRVQISTVATFVSKYVYGF